MTILPKKKPSQEKRTNEVENTSHLGGHSHTHSHSLTAGHHAHSSSNVESGRGGARPKSRNSPPRWVGLGSLDDRISTHETLGSFDSTERRENPHNSHSGSKRARHRSSPHRHERSKRPVPRKHHRDLPSGSGLQLGRQNSVQIPEAVEIDFNSGDEYEDEVDHTTSEETEEVLQL